MFRYRRWKQVQTFKKKNHASSGLGAFSVAPPVLLLLLLLQTEKGKMVVDIVLAEDIMLIKRFLPRDK